MSAPVYSPTESNHKLKTASERFPSEGYKSNLPFSKLFEKFYILY